MENIDNNQFELKPVNSKRKIDTPCPNVYLNPALDLLANEDPMCNTVMEVPNKKKKLTKCLKNSEVKTFENSALDVALRKATNEVMAREIENVTRNVKLDLNNDTNYSNCSLSKQPAFECYRNVENQDDSFNFTNAIENLDSTNDNLENTCDNINQIEVNQSLVTEPIYANIVQSHIPPNSYTETQNFTQTENTHNLNETDSSLQIIEIPKSDFEFSDISKIPHEDFDSGISVLEQKTIQNGKNNSFNVTNVQASVKTHTVVNTNQNISLSFIDRLAIDSPNVTDGSLILDDDLNESNIMEIKTITIITKKKRIVDKKASSLPKPIIKSTNPFLDPNLVNDTDCNTTNNPFLSMNDVTYKAEENNDREITPNDNLLVPRRLFAGDTNSTISTVDDSLESQHEYENVNTRSESPIYENIEDLNYNKQSKVLGCDVSQFSTSDILNKGNNSNESNDSKKSKISKVGKLSKKVFKTLKKTFKHDKVDSNTTLNPYEVPRKQAKVKTVAKDSGIENPALNLDISDDLEIDELSDEDHQYETIKTIRNTQLNMNLTPLRERDNDLDFSHKTNTPGKKVRFDSTLNREKIITGNSFDCGIQSPGFDEKLDKYHDELENCINERKFLQQNM